MAPKESVHISSDGDVNSSSVVYSSPSSKVDNALASHCRRSPSSILVIDSSCM